MLQLITIIQGKWWVSFVTLCLSVHKIIPDNYFDCLSALSLNASCEVLYDTFTGGRLGMHWMEEEILGKLQVSGIGNIG